MNDEPKYGTPEFAHHRRQLKMQEVAERAGATATQFARNVTENDRAFKERQARIEAEKAERQKQRDRADDMRLSADRARMRAEYLIAHGANRGYEFDRLWDTELRQSLLTQEQESAVDREVAAQLRRRYGG